MPLQKRFPRKFTLENLIITRIKSMCFIFSVRVCTIQFLAWAAEVCASVLSHEPRFGENDDTKISAAIAKFVPASINWTDAGIAARTCAFNSAFDYSANITSAVENSFI